MYNLTTSYKMNYKIIADENKLKEFIDWLPELQENEKYYVSLLARKKYSKESVLKADKAQLKRFTATKERLLEKIRQLEIPLGYWKIKDTVAPQDALALYISLNPRCMQKATMLLGKRCWDLIKNTNYNIHAEALSCIQKSKARTCFLDFDIDDKTIDIDINWLEKEVGKENFSIVETRGGYHLLIQPEKATQFRKEKHNNTNWYKEIQAKYPVDQSGDQLIPIVGTFQGGFMPNFLKK